MDKGVQGDGFGTILEKAVLKGIGGSLSRDWTPGGLVLLLKIPLASLTN
jgi:hypothetical protein